jgi:hypothetical protein
MVHLVYGTDFDLMALVYRTQVIKTTKFLLIFQYSQFVISILLESDKDLTPWATPSSMAFMRAADNHGLKPQRLAADKSYGTGPFLSWLLDRKVEPHRNPVFHAASGMSLFAHHWNSAALSEDLGETFIDGGRITAEPSEHEAKGLPFRLAMLDAERVEGIHEVGIDSKPLLDVLLPGQSLAVLLSELVEFEPLVLVEQTCDIREVGGGKEPEQLFFGEIVVGRSLVCHVPSLSVGRWIVRLIISAHPVSRQKCGI